MALSSGPKLNSSASKRPKPTYRRTVSSKKAKAGAASKATNASKPSSLSKAASVLSKASKGTAKIPLKKRVVTASKTMGKQESSAGSALFSKRGDTAKALLRPRVLITALVLVVALSVAGLVVANSPMFAATEIEIQGSEHIEKETVERLIKVPEGTTLLNVNEGAILESLKADPWVAGIKVERSWPHKLTITPVEHKVRAIAYISADELAWAISDNDTWIAPVSLAAAVDADGNAVALNSDGTAPEGSTELTPADAAQLAANDAGALLFTDVPSDTNPKGGDAVSAEVVKAGLTYAQDFSSDFVSTIKSMSLASKESISALLNNGVEVSLGSPDNITEKERVITKLLEEQEGVTYINVRQPGAYTFRAAPKID